MSNPIIEKIEKEYDKLFWEEGLKYVVDTKSFYRQKITELLESLAKEAMNGFEKARQFQHSDELHCGCMALAEEEVISAFEKIGIKVK